jgi:hypothetical protein
MECNKERDMQLILATGVNENFGQIRNNRGLVHLSMAEICSWRNLKGAITDRAHTPINFPIIRLGDVLLMLSKRTTSQSIG